ncbi:putative ribosomal RNA large subunit methyltransferase H [Rosellinia necatrix]|uniref:Putative ribosomal RNA large subunit methyltransferase H n=1 Tax=Rosellinia necatrix TaxID=77044 RepID=A0A1S7UMR3_ROSNE|nr:putative ribosomal RNA large subunit methyltransferase H [Rosellinia necatrix]
MPPKRKSTGSSGPASKKTKTATATASPPSPPPPPPEPVVTYEPPRSKRWAPVSGSANAEAHYRMLWKDEKKAYSYITICNPLSINDDDNDDDDDGDSDGGDKSDDEEEDEEEEEEEEDRGGDGDDGHANRFKRLGPRCGKKGCVCFLPLTLNPDHPWIISNAGYMKFENQFIQLSLRDPDNFGMYTFNDHAGHGSYEVLQNLFLDFDEAAKEKRGGWREQWAICEAVGLWLSQQDSLMFTQTDSAGEVYTTTELVGRMFLAMLAQLDGEGLVGDATAVQSLGCTMALYMSLAHDLRRDGFLRERPRAAAAAAAAARGGSKFRPDRFDDAILTYANRRGVTLSGPDAIEELTAEAVGDVALPAAAPAARDPWGWKAALARYVRGDGAPPKIGSGRAVAAVGGDAYDITTWSPAQRKAAAFGNKKKDPIAKSHLEALKQGMVLQMG